VVALPPPFNDKALKPGCLRVIKRATAFERVKPTQALPVVPTPAPGASAGTAEPVAKRPRLCVASLLAEQKEIDFWSGFVAGSKVLVVGDANFSFAYSLALRMGTAEGMICTDTGTIISSRDTAATHMLPLFEMGATICTRVDSMRLGKHSLVRRCGQYFDFVVWNFPWASTGQLPGGEEECRNIIQRYLRQTELVLAEGGMCSLTVTDDTSFGLCHVHTISQGNMVYTGAESFTQTKFPDFLPYVPKTGAVQQTYPAVTYVWTFTPGGKAPEPA